jgi:hypothetical protein
MPLFYLRNSFSTKTGHETDNASHVVLLVLQIVCSAKHCHVFWKLLISITASTKFDFPVDVLVDGTIPRLGSSDHNRWIGYWTVTIERPVVARPRRCSRHPSRAEIVKHSAEHVETTRKVSSVIWCPPASTTRAGRGSPSSIYRSAPRKLDTFASPTTSSSRPVPPHPDPTANHLRSRTRIGAADSVRDESWVVRPLILLLPFSALLWFACFFACRLVGARGVPPGRILRRSREARSGGVSPALDPDPRIRVANFGFVTFGGCDDVSSWSILLSVMQLGMEHFVMINGSALLWLCFGSLGTGRTLLPLTVFCINVLQKVPSHIAVMWGSISHI